MMFITFEGIEGSGKTTQIERLKTYLESQQHTVVVTKEPGGTSFGQHIREMILNPNTTFSHSYTELLLFYADRAEHVEQVVKPALSNNNIVICDRYIDSTYAYQCAGRGLPKQYIDQLNSIINLTPDITILLDCDPKVGLQRASKRAALDRFEQEELSFHTKVREAFIKQAELNQNRIHVVHTENKDITSIENYIQTQIIKKSKFFKDIIR